MSKEEITYNFIELTNWPRKMDCNTLFSLVVSAGNIVPKSCQLIIKKNIYGDVDDVALLEYTTEAEALKAMDRMARAIYATKWNMTITKNPLQGK